MNTAMIRSQLKQIVSMVPGAHKTYDKLHRINSIRIEFNNTKTQIKELSDLISANKAIVLNPYYKMDKDNILINEIVHDIVKDFLNAYRTVRVRRKTALSLDLPKESVLLSQPLGLLRIPQKYEEYLRLIGDKTRNMIRKAEKHKYQFKEFSWNDHLDEIFEINTSKAVRQGEAMMGWYNNPVMPRYHIVEEQQYRKYYGAFKNGQLYAYLHIVKCGDFAFFRHFMGHAQHLTYGIMNGLISWVVKENIGSNQIRWLKYGTLSVHSNSMFSFRRHAGFNGYAIFLNLEDDQELFNFSHNVQLKPWWFV